MQDFIVTTDKPANINKSLFIPFEDVTGVNWIEFQFRKTNDTHKDVFHDITFWEKDSLFVRASYAVLFEVEFGKYLKPIHTLYNKGEFDVYEAYLYTKEETAAIVEKIKKAKPLDCEIIIPWLEKAASEYNGFLFIGL